jgi:hypothetical protein
MNGLESLPPDLDRKEAWLLTMRNQSKVFIQGGQKVLVLHGANYRLFSIADYNSFTLH